jgi:hypothetical protein
MSIEQWWNDTDGVKHEILAFERLPLYQAGK